MFICWCLFTSLSTQAQRDSGYASCSDEPTYSPGSTFQANLNLLLTFLSSNATKNNGFYNSTVGYDSPDVAYGLSLCRGDCSSDICQTCISEVTKNILIRCPKAKEAAMWHDECMVRYSYRSFIATNNETLVFSFGNPGSVKEEASFKQVLDSTLNDLITRASNVTVSHNKYALRGFATQIVNYTRVQTLYGLAQCTPDLSGNDCGHCLKEAISYLPQCCSTKRGGRVLLYSCNFRYEVYSFFNILDSAPSPSPLPSTTPSSLQKHKGMP